ncbi:YbjN domain-containing protein [Tessaracoccus sp. HDW20]|uniref:YbjN domain-containing protein n=1 Tax=Tessaracoccus coleopterorum TaxID=2714950 RepID=UPI0018D423A2|nr:YbjN domain-containing protein [Tessaracoccus coleopterorum]NHB84953.1 YbjN domain-containing protein [Tessaracoccus coleopterorum]
MQRVLDILDAMGIGYKVDDEGDVLSIWDGNAFYIYVTGEGDGLQVLGSWGISCPTTSSTGS